MDNYFIQAQRVRRLIQEDFNTVFSLPYPLRSTTPRPTTTPPQELTDKVDVLLTPTSLSPPPLLKNVLAQKSPLDSYVNDVLTVPASLAGIPAMSVPVRMASRSGLEAVIGEEQKECGWGVCDKEEMVGMQLLAQFGDEAALFEVAKALDGKEEVDPEV